MNMSDMIAKEKAKYVIRKTFGETWLSYWLNIENSIMALAYANTYPMATITLEEFDLLDSVYSNLCDFPVRNQQLLDIRTRVIIDVAMHTHKDRETIMSMIPLLNSLKDRLFEGIAEEFKGYDKCE